MELKTISILKADPTLSTDEVPDLKIYFNVPCSEISTEYDLKRVGEIFDREASKLADALFEVLPQGIYDRLVMRLMEKKVSVYFGKG